jgi:hypothetical protein
MDTEIVMPHNPILPILAEIIKYGIKKEEIMEIIFSYKHFVTPEQFLVRYLL